MSHALKTLTVYALVALISVFGALGAVRQYAPGLYHGFADGVKQLPFIEKIHLALPALPPLLAGGLEMPVFGKSNGLFGTAQENEPEAEPPHRIDEEEMRGVWIATVFGIDFPKAQGKAEAQKKELADILDTVKEAGLNTVFFQVRPHGDALYRSALFPWSSYLTGTAGQDPGYDPLAYLLEEADKRGIRVHAWINPYRLTIGSASKPENTHASLPEGSPVKNRPDLTMACGDGRLYLNPGEPEAMQLVVDGVKEILENYNVDGIHFDDYFYPSDMSYNDSASYEKYGKPLGLSLADWRRRNTTTLMAMVKEAVKETRPGVEFGISPSGIWQNKQSSPLGSDTNGFESYSRIFADSRLWVTDEVVDYIAPQIYWAIGTKGSDYETLAKWWRHVTLGTNVKLYIGHAAYRVGADDVWKKPTEIGSQIAMNRMLGAIDGSVFYGYSKIAENALGLRDQLKEFFTDMELAQPLQIAYPASGSTVAAANSYVIGSADPRYPLFLDGKQVDCTVSGYFSLYLPLKTGENEFVFTHQGEELLYTLNSNWSPPPSGSGSSSGGSSQGPKVTVLPKPLVYITKGDQTVVRAEASSSATRLQPLKKGVKGYVTAEANGYYLMDSGNWTYKPNVNILTGESLPICLARSAAVTRSEKTVDISFQLPYFPSYYVEVAEGEVCLTLHQTIGQPLLRADSDPLFGEIQFQQAGPHAVYTLPLQKAGRLYGYHIRYDQEANTLTFRFNNPLTLPLYTAAAGGGAVPGGQTPPGPAAIGLTAPGATASAGQAAAGAAASAGQAAVEPPAAMLPLAGKVIVLDAGHGGKDNGATGPAGSRGKLEKDVNLDLALTLEKVLTEAGAEVRMIRTEDVGIDLEIRADAIREIKPDLAISLHRNSMGAGSDIRLYQGVLALYSHPQSIPLARCLSEALVKGTTHQDGGMRWQSLAMCRIEECPTVLLELGFISNPADYERMNRKSTIQKEAQAILQGLISYMAGS